jgi:hypothetical protein
LPECSAASARRSAWGEFKEFGFEVLANLRPSPSTAWRELWKALADAQG